jgi:hypothetical protein
LVSSDKPTGVQQADLQPLANQAGFSRFNQTMEIWLMPDQVWHVGMQHKLAIFAYPFWVRAYETPLIRRCWWFLFWWWPDVLNITSSEAKNARFFG